MTTPWYCRLGPLSWYADSLTGRVEWVRLCLSWGHRLFADVTVWPWRAWSAHLLGTVLRRSRYGLPSEIAPAFTFPAWPARRAVP